jgi:hypothetical protein
LVPLQPSEYDASYFDGALNPPAHPAGYESYARWHRFDLSQPGGVSLGEYWLDLANRLRGKMGFAGKKVLEIGSAKGFAVQDLRSMGVDATGVDVSQYAYSQASATVQPFLVVADIRNWLSSLPTNGFDAAFSLNTLCVFTEAELPGIVTQLNRISRNQFHLINETPNPAYYLTKPLTWWASLNWAKGTILAGADSGTEVIK